MQRIQDVLSGLSLLKILIQVGIAVFWAFGAIFTSELEATHGYAKPFFITYTSSLITGVLLIPLTWFIRKLFPQLASAPPNDVSTGINSATPTTQYRWFEIPPDFEVFSLRGLLWTFIFGVLAFGANMLFAVALSFTNVPSALTLEQLTPIFIFILSLIFLREGWDWRKPIAMLVAVGGAVMVAWSDTKQNSKAGSHPLTGDFCSVGVAALAATYMVGFSYLFNNVFGLEMVMKFFILKDILMVLVLWPFFFVLNATKWEVFKWPDKPVQWVFMIFGDMFGIAFNVFLNWGIIVLSPLSSRLSILLGLPISFVWDVIATKTWNWMRFGGLLVVLVGVICFEAICVHLEQKKKNAALASLLPSDEKQGQAQSQSTSDEGAAAI
eukprot:TRINITY_DN76968_c0_g1_i1.p1 TRINITY_DN76968_c0_g1~~TRINITY_DN76968_c0_g1_i1.p1  ORF type:complete len:382 (-),score=32.86 TRINITY_DN76968_c0_g1_i1:140-1285(-)